MSISSEAWSAHPDPYFIRYEKVRVPCGFQAAIEVKSRNGQLVSMRVKKSAFITRYLMHRAAFNNNGDYIGNVHIAHFLCRKMGIVPEPMHPGKICCIGKSRIDSKWYGWSHRAIYGFQIGDVVKKGDITASSGLIESYRLEHPEEDLSLPIGFVARTEEDARRMAIAFAEAVS